jgi:hypothetical protein
MQLYFIKATYTGNIYKITDFFTIDGASYEYKLIANKMININFKPEDGLTSFITKQTQLDDETYIRDHTHIICPDYNKIYKIVSIDYMNNDQYMITLDDDPLIANYDTLLNSKILITRTNDPDYWRGMNDIADMTLKEDVTLKAVSSSTRTGKWALLFFSYNPDDDYIGLRFDNTVYGNFIEEATLTTLRDNYPEVSTTRPEEYEYYQKCAYVAGTSKRYQCVWNNAGAGSLKWVEYVDTTTLVHYFKQSEVQQAKINKTDVLTTCIALPFETVLRSSNVFNRPLLSYDKFVGPVDANLLDIKIISDHYFEIDAVSYSLSGEVMSKNVTLEDGCGLTMPTYSDSDGTDTITGFDVLSLFIFKTDIDISANFYADDTTNPKRAEPFAKYDLYVYGKKFSIPVYLSDDIHLLMAINSGVINYIIYYNDRRNILASGSFTHSIRYQLDQLDSFYSQNPTYKEQFFTKMAIDSVKNVVGGAIGGSVIPGVGTLMGAGAGLVSSGIDAGISMLNLHYQEKGLKMKPDQIFGEISEVSLQSINIFGIYWVRRDSENDDLMLSEYELRGFPTLKYDYLYNMEKSSTTLFGNALILFGDVKTIVVNNHVTNFINAKLKEGVIFL